MLKLKGSKIGEAIIKNYVERKSPAKDMLVETLEDTVKYPDEDQGSDTKDAENQGPNEGSLDPTVYYGSTDEEYEVDYQAYLDDTEEYVPTQQSRQLSSHHRQVQLTERQEKIAPKSNHIIDHLSQVYLNSLQLLEYDRYDSAFKQVLDMNDDFYLMKLMTKTGTCWDKLQDSTAHSLRQRIQEIFKSGFLDSLKTQWIGSGVEDD